AVSTFATRAISSVSSRSQSFHPNLEANCFAISPAPQPYSRSMVITRNMAPCTLPYPDLGFNRHAGPQDVLPGFSRVKGDLCWNSLYHFDEVSGGILGRQQACHRAAGAGDTLQVAFVILPRRVHMNGDRLADAHIAQLRLLEVGSDPDVVKIDDSHQFLTRLHILANFNGAARDHAIHRRHNGGVLQVQLRLIESRLFSFYLGFGRLGS